MFLAAVLWSISRWLISGFVVAAIAVMLPPKSIEADNVTAITFFEVFFILFPPLLLYCFLVMFFAFRC